MLSLYAIFVYIRSCRIPHNYLIHSSGLQQTLSVAALAQVVCLPRYRILSIVFLLSNVHCILTLDVLRSVLQMNFVMRTAIVVLQYWPKLLVPLLLLNQ